MQFDFWQAGAGLALFLLAMSIIEQAIARLAGKSVKAFIRRHTQHKVRGVLAGTLATSVLQSSSLVGLLALAFVGAGIMQLPNALLIIIGANLGTTATGWLVTLLGFKLDLQVISLPLITLGGLCWVAAGERWLAHYGRLGLGLGLLLLALGLMKTAVAGADAVVQPEFFARFSLWQFVLFGAVFTALVQSSSAAMVIVLSALHAEFVDLYAAAAFMIGADLGTTSTVVLGAVGGSANKKRVALGHFLFNVGTDLLAFILILPLVTVLAKIGDPLLSLVAFHTTFNLLGVMLWTPFVPHFARLLQRMFITSESQHNSMLDVSAQYVPEAATTAVYREVVRLAGSVVTQNAGVFSHADESDQLFKQRYQDSKQLEAQILSFALDLDLKQADKVLRDQLESMLHAARNLLLSSKLIKDNLSGLNRLADYHEPMFVDMLQSQQEICAALLEFGMEFGALTFEQIEAHLQACHRSHEQLHHAIYEAIQADRVPANRVSSLLNLNRALLNSNMALFAGLGALVGVGQTDAGLVQVNTACITNPAQATMPSAAVAVSHR